MLIYTVVPQEILASSTFAILAKKFKLNCSRFPFSWLQYLVVIFKTFIDLVRSFSCGEPFPAPTRKILGKNHDY